jgi:hypothetical protein
MGDYEMLVNRSVLEYFVKVMQRKIVDPNDDSLAPELLVILSPLDMFEVIFAATANLPNIVVACYRQPECDASLFDDDDDNNTSWLDLLPTRMSPRPILVQRDGVADSKARWCSRFQSTHDERSNATLVSLRNEQ